MALDDRRNRIDPDALRLLWEQVADDIRSDIDTGRLAPGARLPSEFELADQYGVSRATIRRATAELISEGKAVILRGRGTYIR
jgi:DNA-binding GntR family transcriptional regulator